MNSHDCNDHAVYSEDFLGNQKILKQLINQHSQRINCWHFTCIGGSVVPEGAQPVAAVGRPHFNH